MKAAPAGYVLIMSNGQPTNQPDGGVQELQSLCGKCGSVQSVRRSKRHGRFRRLTFVDALTLNGRLNADRGRPLRARVSDPEIPTAGDRPPARS
jgi:hypothetical protein